MNISLGNTVTWSPVVGVTSYRVELLNQLGEIVQTLTREDPQVSALALFSGLPSGNYRVRVRGETAEFQGPWSELLALEFVLFGAPTGLTVV